MEVLVVNEYLEPLTIIDTFKSLIWADRFFELGDFELYSTFDSSILNSMPKGSYVWFSNSERLMIVESYAIITDLEEGPHMVIKGYSIESLLNRRIIWNRTILNGNFQIAVKKLLDENAINPLDSVRAIPNLIFQSSLDPVITSLSIDTQLTGENLYETIKSMCSERNIGFKITPNENGKLVFSLYAGVNRAYSQDINPYVIFAPEFDNLINSDYEEDDSPLKTVALIGGEGEGLDRKYVSIGTASGLNRRELFVDARDISSKAETTGGAPLTIAQYNAQLIQRGIEKLSENSSVIKAEAEADTTRNFVYGVDFFIGDIVQLANEFGMELEARVTEVIFAQDETKETTIPTFTLVSQSMSRSNYTPI